MQSSTTPEQSPQNSTSTNARSQPSTVQRSAKTKVLNSVEKVYDAMLWRIDARALTRETLAVGVAGCLPKSGASTIAANLAKRASFQERGRILLIDANWDPPGMAKMFKLEPSLGVYDILSGDASPRECEPQAVNENLDVLCRGKLNATQPPRVQVELIEEMLRELKSQYGLILVDLPVAESLRSALPLARKLDGTLLVSRFEVVKQAQAKRALRRLREDGVEVWGSILNRHKEYVPRWLRDLLG